MIDGLGGFLCALGGCLVSSVVWFGSLSPPKRSLRHYYFVLSGTLERPEKTKQELRKKWKPTPRPIGIENMWGRQTLMEASVKNEGMKGAIDKHPSNCAAALEKTACDKARR
eukprot:2284890-Amphidinium_carterae.1